MASTPYEEVVEWVEDHAEAPAADKLAKLILSLARGGCAFSLREVFDDLGEAQSVLALRAIAHYAQRGEDSALREAGERISDGYQDLCVLGQVAHRAQEALIDRWPPSSKND